VQPRKGNASKRLTGHSPLFDARDDGRSGRNNDRPRMTKYGSIVGTPPKNDAIIGAPLPSLKLPDPAISATSGPARKRPQKTVRLPDPKLPIENSEPSPSAYEAGKTRAPSYDKVSFRGNPFRKTGNGTPSSTGMRTPTRTPTSSWDRSRFRRLLSIGESGQPPTTKSDPDLPLDVYHEFDHARGEFFLFLDDELDKIDEFYQEKEDEAIKRLQILREQLHILRDRRIQDLNKAGREIRQANPDASKTGGSSDSDEVNGNNPPSKNSSHAWLPAVVDRAWDVALNGRIGKQTKVMESETTPEAFRPMDDRRDYERRVQDIEVPYRTAKRKLKLAMQEYYRSLELLKSYTLLNRTAFRKITKKYDKTVNARPNGRYMSERVGKAHFIKSDVVDGIITTVEDLYSRYFEAGNHKVAANKLRKLSRQRDYHGGAMFRNGLTIAFGAVLGVQGLVAAGQLLFHDDATVVSQTSFLLQV
jgi:hypothetical protein